MDIINILKEFAFPAAISLILLYFLNEQQKKFSENLIKIIENHHSEVMKLTITIDENTKILELLQEKLKGE